MCELAKSNNSILLYYFDSVNVMSKYVNFFIVIFVDTSKATRDFPVMSLTFFLRNYGDISLQMTFNKEFRYVDLFKIEEKYLPI